ncbi:MAG: hypothetical protein R3D84_07460 [Paracoccaceae bacterium]
MSDSQGGMMHAAVQALSAEVRLSRLCAHLERVSLAQTVREIRDDHLAFSATTAFAG